MRTTIISLVSAAILLFAAGCGPGEPFEIEGMHTPQSGAPSQILAAK